MSTKDLGGVLTEIFSTRDSTGAPHGATIKAKRLYLLFPAQVLKVPVGRSRYSATRKPPPDADLSPWERALLVESDHSARGRLPD